MGIMLVGGCAVAGAVAGALLDTVVVSVHRPPAVPAEDAGDEDGTVLERPLPGAPALRAAVDVDTLTTPIGSARTAERLVAAAVTALLLGAAAYRLGAQPELAAYCVLFVGLVGVSIVDIRVGLVPRKILYPTLGLLAAALLGAAAAAGSWRPLLDAGTGGAGAFVVFFAIWWLSPRAMGFGDVRLAGVVGVALGWLGYRQLYLGFLAAFVAGAVIGLVKMGVQGTGRKTALPFGPALALGAVVGVLWGGYLGNLWLHPAG